MKLQEIAAKINAYLKSFEQDPKVNTLSGQGLRSYYNASAGTAGRYVRISYISYQGGSRLTKAEAEEYLAWLDAGNKGKHYRMEQR